MIIIPILVSCDIVSDSHYESFPLNLRHKIIQANAKREPIKLGVDTFGEPCCDLASRLPRIESKPDRDGFIEGDVADADLPQNIRPVETEVKILQGDIGIQTGFLGHIDGAHNQLLLWATDIIVTVNKGWKVTISSACILRWTTVTGHGQRFLFRKK
jgi:hypothetical protein